MIKQFKHKNIILVNVIAPTKEEVKNLTQIYNLNPTITKDLLENKITSHNQVDFFSNHLYLNTTWPNHPNCWPTEQKSTTEIIQLKIIIGRDFLITINQDNFPPLENLDEIFGSEGGFEQDKIIDSGLVFFHLIKYLYKIIDQGLDQLNQSTRHQDINLTETWSEVLNFSNCLLPHNHIWSSIQIAEKAIFKKEEKVNLLRLKSEQKQLIQKLNLLKQDLNYQQLNKKNNLLSTITEQNKLTQKILSYTLPLLIFLALLGINLPLPFLTDHPQAFYLVLGLIGLIILIIYQLLNK